jgi:hypothetical protein
MKFVFYIALICICVLRDTYAFTRECDSIFYSNYSAEAVEFGKFDRHAQRTNNGCYNHCLSLAQRVSGSKVREPYRLFRKRGTRFR